MAVNRVLLGVAPRLLRDLIEECLMLCTGLHVTGGVVDEPSLLEKLGLHDPDVILLTLPDPVSRHRLERLIAANPQCTWWLLNSESNGVERVQGACVIKFDALSPQQLVEAIMDSKQKPENRSG